ncbi:MAG: hypothetical protein F6J93_19185 [Oscillatoria sp. SIO1A7]|nr:hypothetical protein [Oscillatoria sp. SIO1A7]
MFNTNFRGANLENANEGDRSI